MVKFSHYTIIGTTDVIIFKYFFDIERPNSTTSDYWAYSKIPMMQKMIPYTDTQSTIIQLPPGEHFVIVNVAEAPLQYGTHFDINTEPVNFTVEDY